jgi:hypothetical protein
LLRFCLEVELRLRLRLRLGLALALAVDSPPLLLWRRLRREGEPCRYRLSHVAIRHADADLRLFSGWDIVAHMEDCGR